jgi:hypothetical protein
MFLLLHRADSWMLRISFLDWNDCHWFVSIMVGLDSLVIKTTLISVATRRFPLPLRLPKHYAQGRR